MATVVLLFIGLGVFTAIRLQRAADPLPANAPAEQFSSARAMTYLEAFARKPHPVGSAEHAAVRDYIVSQLTAQGLNPEVQKTTAVNTDSRIPIVAGEVENIVAKLKGTGDGKAVMLVGHYDSVATGPGASDDGSAVAMMIEAVRALQTGPPLKNDLFVVLTDGEEAGLLGARAFVEQPELTRKVGVVLNFEARGTSGPVIMFESSPNDSWLISEFAKASPHPIATSLASSIYKMLPNDTDFSVFKKAGLNGLNFAFIQGVNHYHSSLDSVEQIDPGSLQHEGDYTLALARHFGNLDLERKADGDATFFNAGPAYLHYPMSLALPLSLLAAVLFFATVGFGLRRRKLKLSGLAFGFAALLVSTVCAALVVGLVWWAINKTHSDYALILQGETYGSGLYFLGFVAATIAVTAVVFNWFGKKTDAQSLALGAMFWWVILALLTALILPGASYVFAWPVIFGALALGLTLTLKDNDSPAAKPKRLAIILAGAAPAIFLVAPVIHFVYLALTESASWVLAILVALLLGILMPALQPIMTLSRRLLPAALAVLSLAFIISGHFAGRFDAQHPKPSNLFYALSADTGKAVWASFDKSPDEWTGQFLAGGSRGDLNDYLPSDYQDFLRAPAPPAPLDAPDVKLVGEASGNGTRIMKFLVSSPRRAALLSLYTDRRAQVVDATINGKPAFNSAVNRWGLRFHGIPKEGIQLTLEIKSTEPLTIRALDLSYGLPELPGATSNPRPDRLMPSLYPYSDSTLVGKTFTFN